MELHELTITQIQQGLRRNEFSALELVKSFLDRIEERNKDIFAFLTVTSEQALEQAKEVDDMLRAGVRDLPPLAGIPIAIKDNICVENIRCTAGSRILENYIAPYDATVVRKLKMQKAVLIGKTNLDEFAMGSSTERSAFGPTKNPYDLSRVPGGSSGGSAAAVADMQCCAALGSDTGGSIRQPAAFCGVVGLKPTYGAVSRYGLIAMASSLDQIGPLARTVDDAKILFEAIKGKDEKDSTSVDFSLVEDRKFKIENLKVGVPKEYFIEGMDKEVEKIVYRVIEKIEELDINVEEISLPHTDYALATYYIIMPCEVSANLARYDGIKYGYSEFKDSSVNPKTLLDVYLHTRGKGFGEEVRRRIMLGTYALSAGYYEAYYLRAQKVRSKIREDFRKAFEKVDIIITPTTPTPAFAIGEKISDPLTMYLSDIFTISANLAGIPALSLPAGKVGSLPVGVQLMADLFNEDKLFVLGKTLEEVLDFKA